MRVIYLDCQTRSITGGHKYNDAVLNYLTEWAHAEIIKTPSCAALYKGWRKMYAPIAELKRLKTMNKGDLVLWGDTTVRYHYLLATVARWVKTIHSVIIIHHFPEFPSSLLGRTRRWLQLHYISKCGDIIVPSPYTLDIANKLFPDKRVFYIPLPFEKRFEVSPNYQPGNFLFVGAIEKRKGLHFLVDALNILHQRLPALSFSLNVVGKIVDQDYYSQLRDKLVSYGIEDRVHFCGRVTNEELNYYYDTAEIFTFPSLLEGYGIVLVEAMYRGLPIIAFNNSAMPYSIQDGVNGFLANNMNADSFAEKIMLLTGNNDLRIRLQKGIKETVSDLKTQEDFEAGIRDLVEKVIR